MTPLNAVTTIIQHPNNPNNVRIMPKQERPKRLLVFVGRIGHEKFSDEPDSPMGKGFFVEGLSKLQWDYLRINGGAEWILNNGFKYKVDGHKWLEGHYAYLQRIKLFMLKQLGLDPRKYHIMTWMTDAFKPMPTLREIQP